MPCIHGLTDCEECESRNADLWADWCNGEVTDYIPEMNKPDLSDERPGLIG